jgi:lipoprotein-releasing system ATP-binding protein
MSNVVLEVRHLNYTYAGELLDIPVLKDLSFRLHRKERVALVGASGVGKSTFLHVLGLLDVPKSGEVILTDGQQVINTNGLVDNQRSALRSNLIGFVYQFHHLLAEFTALENVIIPQMIAGKAFKGAKEKAEELLVMVGLEDRMTHRPSQLSGGQQQRVAIARALANDPDILLADEPTGNLDEKTAQEIFGLFLMLSQKRGLSMVMATHNIELRRQFDRVVSLHEGSLTELNSSHEGLLS